MDPEGKLLILGRVPTVSGCLAGNVREVDCNIWPRQLYLSVNSIENSLHVSNAVITWNDALDR